MQHLKCKEKMLFVNAAAINLGNLGNLGDLQLMYAHTHTHLWRY